MSKGNKGGSSREEKDLEYYSEEANEGQTFRRNRALPSVKRCREGLHGVSQQEDVALGNEEVMLSSENSLKEW